MFFECPVMNALFLCKSFLVIEVVYIFRFSCFKADPPIFAVSSVSGYGLGGLLNFLAIVSSKPDNGGLTNAQEPTPATKTTQSSQNYDNDLVDCWITKVFGQVPGVDGPVLEVLVKSGKVHENQKLWLGPDSVSDFYQ